jgi:hypothetical protein
MKISISKHESDYQQRKGKEEEKIMRPEAPKLYFFRDGDKSEEVGYSSKPNHVGIGKTETGCLRNNYGVNKSE